MITIQSSRRMLFRSRVDHPVAMLDKDASTIRQLRSLSSAHRLVLFDLCQIIVYRCRRVVSFNKLVITKHDRIAFAAFVLLLPREVYLRFPVHRKRPLRFSTVDRPAVVQLVDIRV